MQRQTLTFSQRKANDDADICKECADILRHAIGNWRRATVFNESVHMETSRSISELANKVQNVDAFLYLSPNENKCAYYSLVCSDMEKVSQKFGLTHYRQI
jgi:hypothetical protein